MTRHGGVWLLLCLLPLGSGCFWFRPTDKGEWSKSLRPPTGFGDENLVTLDLAILQRPLGDRFLNEELWTNVDDMILDLEKNNLLQRNGFRVGQVVGLTPGSLQTLLKSERYCLNPRQRMVPSGQAMQQVLGPVHPQASFTVVDADRKSAVDLDQARFLLEIVPTITREGKVQLEFTPKAETGEQMLPFKPDLAQSTWTLRVDKPHRAFPQLSWRVNLEPNRWLVIGTSIDEPDTLGYRTFTQEDGPKVQRLLVLRVHAPHRSKTEDEFGLDSILHSSTCPPLALQATFTGK